MAEDPSAGLSKEFVQDQLHHSLAKNVKGREFWRQYFLGEDDFTLWPSFPLEGDNDGFVLSLESQGFLRLGESWSWV